MGTPFRPLGIAILLLLAMVLVGCQQPTTDPDQALRDMLVGKTWLHDTSFSDTNPIFIRFSPDGTAIEGGSHSCTWTIKSGVLSIKNYQGTDDVTAPLVLDAHHLVIQYLGTTVHLVV